MSYTFPLLFEKSTIPVPTSPIKIEKQYHIRKNILSKLVNINKL